MTPTTPQRCVAFDGDRRIAAGPVSEVAAAAKRVVDRDDHGPVLVFDAVTSEPVELDLRGSLEDVRGRYSGAPAAASAPPLEGEAKKSRRGRPRLGVVSKEVTLLPRHWAWLSTQQGSASATLRRLVERARREGSQDDRARLSQDATYRFMYATLGDQAGFEEAVRALYAGDAERFEAESEAWPPDLRDHSRRLAEGAVHGRAIDDEAR